uniref:Uncharacterized protein n=1 Tax=Chelonoidis abingdonii TaxID=106734 RepID=A0A8C0HAK5_CHEAB
MPVCWPPSLLFPAGLQHGPAGMAMSLLYVPYAMQLASLGGARIHSRDWKSAPFAPPLCLLPCEMGTGRQSAKSLLGLKWLLCSIPLAVHGSVCGYIDLVWGLVLWIEKNFFFYSLWVFITFIPRTVVVRKYLV